MGVTNFQIVFDSPTGAYYAGQNVTGKILLSLDKPKKVRALTIKFEGIAKVSWTESESVRQNDGNTRTENVTYTGDEEYFSNKYNLAGGGSGEHEIPAGDHVYPFSTSLPPLLPSSFDGEHGHVRYMVKAILDRPWKFDQDVKAVFTVVTPIDLNFNQRAKEPVNQDTEKTFCCLCCESGPLTLVVSLPCSGYVPGQSVPLTVEVDNASNVAVAGVKAKLMKELKWTAREPNKKIRHDKVELAVLTLEGVATNGSKSWTQLLAVPSMPVPNVDQCTLISIAYELKVEAEVTGPHRNLEIDIPIFLGTVPVYLPPTAGSTDFKAPVAPGALYPTIQDPAAPLPIPEPPADGPTVGFKI